MWLKRFMTFLADKKQANDMSRWAICSHDGEPIIIKVINADTGALEEMEFYTSSDIAYTALEMMSHEDRIHYGAHVQEVGDA
jgi:hypothetical protein